MFITKLSLPRRTFLRGVGRHAGAAAARLDGAGADGAGARRPPARSRGSGSSTSRTASIMDALDADDGGRRLRVHADPEAARAVPRSRWSSSATCAAPRRTTAATPRRAGSWLTGVVAEADRRPGLPRRHDDRPAGREADRTGHDVSVARSRHRGFHRPRRRVRPRLQLRLHEHARLADADDAAADGDQPARGVRADVRRRATGEAAAGAHADTTAAFSISSRRI